MHIIRGNRTEIGEVLGPIQYGCAISNGLSFAYTLAQERLLDADLMHAGCKLDIKSFFNNLDRNTMLSELYSHSSLAQLWRITSWAYSKPTEVFFRSRGGEVIDSFHSKQGARQGDPMSSALCAIGALPTFARTIADTPRVTAVLIQDDCHLDGPPADVIQAHFSLSEALPAINLQENPTKLKFAWFHDEELPHTVTSYLDKLDCKPCMGYSFGGSPVAANADIARSLLLFTF